jgi:endonuclease YncB( thermonuclease family)
MAAPSWACVPPGPQDPRLAAKIETHAVVDRIADGRTLMLQGGAVLRLAGIETPRHDEPLGPEAEAALSGLALGKALRLYPGAAPYDRYGHLFAQAYLEDKGLWLQGALLDQGFARVYSVKDNRACGAELLAREGMARAAGRGLWALSDYAIRRADALGAADIGRFVLVEGTIRAAAVFDDKAYLNFGADYRTDFTAIIEAPDLALFQAEGYDLKGLRGQPVRLRGWLQRLNGPMMTISHPEQIEKIAGH